MSRGRITTCTVCSYAVAQRGWKYNMLSPGGRLPLWCLGPVKKRKLYTSAFAIVVNYE